MESTDRIQGEPAAGGTDRGEAYRAEAGAGVVVSQRSRAWASTMAGSRGPGRVTFAHETAGARVHPGGGGGAYRGRLAREEREDRELASGATRARGAGRRARPEEPDEERTCFERDRDRILHSTAFRRLAGKTQVFVFPADHQRTRLTHALEVAQVATAVARASGLNVALTEAIALGHDCGHGPGGHASEEAFDAFLPEGYDHAVWGATALAPLNLCAETLDGIRNHSWSRPVPATPEGEVVSWADRCAYTAHDLEDAAGAGIVDPDDLPREVVAVCGARRGRQLSVFVRALIGCIARTGRVGMDEEVAAALAGLRAFNYERIYTRPASVAQGRAVITMLRPLVEYFAARPGLLPDPPGAYGRGGTPAPPIPGPGLPPPGGLGPHRPEPGSEEAVRAAVAYVAGMTDRYACATAVAALGWDESRLPRGIDLGDRHG